MGKKTVVIGAGVGGCASAALLQQAGHAVTLIETHPFVGGRCASMEKDGFRYDFGVHMFSRGDRGPHGEVNRRLGGDLRWITRDPACRVLGAADFDFPLDIRSLRRQFHLGRRLGVRPRNYAGAFRLLHALIGGRSAEEDEGVPLRDFVSRFTDDDRMHLFVNCVSQLFFALSSAQASAGEFVWSFSRMFQEASFGYPAGGSGRIPRTFLDRLEVLGGRVRLGETVSRIRVENGAVRAVETSQGEYPADRVVSSCGIARTVALAGRRHFPEAYAKRADALRYSNAYVTVKYALARPVIPHPVVFYMPDPPGGDVFGYIEREEPPEDPYLFMPVPSNLDPGLAPDGRQLVVAGTAAPPGASRELCARIQDRIHGRVCALFPGLANAILWQSRTGRAEASSLTGHPSGEAIGLAQVPGQTASDRPGLRTPVRGLWLVGADAGARGIGTEMAAGSALRLADAIGPG